MNWPGNHIVAISSEEFGMKSKLGHKLLLVLKWWHKSVELSVEVTGLTLPAVSKDKETARALWDF